LILPNGVDLQAFTADNDGNVLRHYGIPLDKKLAGFIGNWEAWLAFDDLLKSSEYLNDDIRLVVIGAGKGLDDFRALYSSILFTGEVPHHDAVSLLNKMDVCICPYSNHSIAKNKSYRKVLEYLAAGKPIVASDAGSKEVFLVDQENALFYETGDAADLAQKVSAIVADESISRKMSLANRKLAKKFSWEKVIAESGMVKALKN
jgi:glycosyltransferase involved in cell wall biosynthesis